jgi:hypothetical protein
MHIIQNNPYRIVGLLVGATAKEQERQIRRLKQFIEAEQDPQDDFSFPRLGKLHRTIDNINDAASKLNLDSDKMNAALFWFYKGNAITDEPAFDAIKEGDISQVLNIWTKLISNGEVSQRNASAFSNLGTLYLSGALESISTNEANLERGISLKLKFLESDFSNSIKDAATDETFRTSKKELQLLFLKQFLSEVGKSGGISSNKLINILIKQEFSAKEDFLKDFAQKPIEQVEKKIEETKAKRKADKANAVNAGNALYVQTLEILMQLKSILGASNLKFTSISDKVSDEMLQCGIDYFSHYKDSSSDPGNASMDLFRKAKTLAIGSIAKQRCQENTENLQEWIDNKPEREKQKLIGDDLQSIYAKLEKFQNLSDTVANAKDLVDSCKPRLANIKNTLGALDDFYLKISSAVVGNAQGMLVSAVNDAQEGFKKYQELGGIHLPLFRDLHDAETNRMIDKLNIVSLDGLSKIVNSAYDVTTSMQTMDMLSNLKQSFQNNREALGNIRSQINSAIIGSISSSTSSGSRSSSGSSGCYIATMAYGNYDHPQVMILRQFRDDVLDQSAFGKWFIKIYYYYSPKLVEKLKNKKTINNLIRKALNQFIKLIK